MQDFSYLSCNDFDITLEIGCDKYPPVEDLPNEWIRNKDALINFIWQVSLSKFHVLFSKIILIVKLSIFRNFLLELLHLKLIYFYE